MAENSVKNLIVDSGGFIRNAPIGEIGHTVYCVKDVVTEIRDKDTRQRLQVLPYEINFREPSTDSIRTVTDFAKKTGDYRSLSAVDLRVLALVYQLEKEKVGTEHIRTVPQRNATWSVRRHVENPTEIAGFYLDKKPGASRSCSESANQTHDPEDPDMPPLEDISPAGTEVKPEDSTNNANTDLKQADSDIQQGDLISADQLEEGSEDEEDEDEEEEMDDEDEDDDDEGWITPSNIKEVKRAMGDTNTEEADVTVGCLTTDFAMQNVLIQMGLNVVSVDGMLIKQAKSYVLRCSGCNKVTTNLQKEFCFHCGNKTLQKVSMTVDDDGTIRYFLSRRKQQTRRGLRFSLPAPQGGKHAVNPRLVEDQGAAHQRMSAKARVKYNVMDADYVVNSSPFAQTDTTSKSALLGVRNHKHNFRSKRNPNENKKVYGRRK